MAYTVTSTYKYITGAELEAFHICTYANIDPLYAEAAVIGQVNQAEYWVNEYCGQTFASGASTPDGVKAATLEMARYFMNVQMVVDEYIEDFPIKLDVIIKLCKTYLEKHKVTPSYSSSHQDFDLRILKS